MVSAQHAWAIIQSCRPPGSKVLRCLVGVGCIFSNTGAMSARDNNMSGPVHPPALCAAACLYPQAFVDAESKLPRMRVGQLERRLQRVVNIVTSYRKALLAALSASCSASAGVCCISDAEDAKQQGADMNEQQCVPPLPALRRARSDLGVLFGRP